MTFVLGIITSREYMSEEVNMTLRARPAVGQNAVLAPTFRREEAGR